MLVIRNQNTLLLLLLLFLLFRMQSLETFHIDELGYEYQTKECQSEKGNQHKIQLFEILATIFDDRWQTARFTIY